MVLIRPVPSEELGRIPEIDVSEDATAIYIQHGTQLEKLHRPFRRELRSAEAWEPEISTWRRFVVEGGRAFGSFEEDRLLGIAVLRAALDKDTAQLAGLYVDRECRRHGFANMLVGAVIDAALATGATNLYVSAVPSESAVGFYLSRGFRPVGTPRPELFDLEPEDIHMSLDIGRERNRSCD